MRTLPLAPSLLLSLLVLGPGAVGCGGDPAEELGDGGRSLLARRPDRVVRQPGVLEPRPEDAWGAYGPHGWDGRARTRATDGRPFVWSRTEAARLVLPASGRRDRTLAVEAWLPAAPEPEDGGAPAPRPVVVRLNGVALGELPLTPRPSVHRVEAPAAAWVEGDNALELAVDALRPPASGSADARYGVAVARVAYDEPREPRLEPERGLVELVPDTGAAWDLEELAPLDLVVAGRADGPGRLALEVTRVDPADGAAREEALSLALDLAGGVVDRRLALPEARGDVLRVRLVWRSEAGATLRLERLDVLDRPSPGGAPSERVPIVLLAIDTLGARHTSLYGYERRTTPRLERLAADAVVFDRCVTNAPWTVPSFFALMSGVHANAHRIDSKLGASREAKLWERWFLAENRWTLAEALRAAGWSTAGFVDNLWLTDRFRFPQGFDHYDTTAGEVDKLDPDGGIRLVKDRALAWLDEHGDEPFFLFLHCFDVHGPYAPPEEFDGLFDDGDTDAGRGERLAGGITNAYGTIPEYVTAARFAEGSTPERLPVGPVVADYDEGVAATDAAVGAFLDELRARGLYDDALVVVTADHGETMARTDFLFGHGVLDANVLEVPLVVKLPGGRGGGRRVGTTVQLVDLYPTLLELAGLPHERPYLSGRSLVPLLEGGTLPEIPTLTETGVMAQSAVHLGSWKLVVEIPGVQSAEHVVLSHPSVPPAWREARLPETVGRPFTDELLAGLRERTDYRGLVRELRRAGRTPLVALYDLAADPWETRDLAASEPERLAELRGHLERLLAERQVARDLAVPPAAPARLDAADAEELRKLGYLAD